MNKKNDFKTFFKNSGVNGIRNVTLAYAFKADSTTFDALSERYGITRRSVRHCIEHCIINCLVDYDTAMQVKEKSHRNQMKHLKKDSVRTTSDKYYDGILRKRLTYVKNLPDEKVIEVANLYMANPNTPCKELAKSLKLSAKEVNIILIKAIGNTLIDEGVIRNLYAISLMKSKSIQDFNPRYEFLKKLEDFRKVNVSKRKVS
jgi:predicted DNA-binding protein